MLYFNFELGHNQFHEVREWPFGSDFYHFNDIIDNYYCEAKAQLAIAKAHCEFIEV